MSNDNLRVRACHPPEMAVMVGETKVILASAALAYPRVDTIVKSGGSIAAVIGPLGALGVPHTAGVVPAGALVLGYVSIPRGVAVIGSSLITEAEPEWRRQS